MPQSPSFSLEDKADSWRIDNVSYRNKIYTVDLSKELLDKGASKTQDDWSVYSQQAQLQSDFHAADLTFYHALFTELYKNKDNHAIKATVEEARSFLEKTFLAEWLMTLTRVQYNPKGKDIIVHNHHMPDEYQIEETIVGPDGYITKPETKAQSALTALLECNQDINEVNNIYKWITQKDAYLWRVNSKPIQVDERVAGFGADSGRTNLFCGRYPWDSGSACGVRFARSARTKN